MADHLTEEEQIEAIKRWWGDNWLSVVAPVVILIVSYTVWNFWGDYKVDQAKKASDKYQALVELYEPLAGAQLEKSAKDKIITLVEEIQTQYSDGMYADLSSLILARIALDSGEIDLAEKNLRVVVDSPANDSVKYVAQTRLARILSEKGQYSDALVLVSNTDIEELKALNAEIRGDIYLAQGEHTAAFTAYQEALNALTQMQMSRRGILQFKLDSLKPAQDATTDDVALNTSLERVDTDATTQE